jgi:hypothetical protein
MAFDNNQGAADHAMAHRRHGKCRFRIRSRAEELCECSQPNVDMCVNGTRGIGAAGETGKLRNERRSK